ncbi:hypothetical protein N0V82_003982 [Gnomoniopsis sp. IMI 355080]|nr:hypothetical protein N0V82_003982 [Gnomoniopsis sp. IMI 355080]
MSETITKVAVAGATGNLGPAIVEQLVSAGFAVTALTRKGGARTFPAGVSAVEVDYDSVDSLVAALQGQDAVVSTLNDAFVPAQLKLIEAASQAGVKRYIPSEFGCDTLNPKTAALPVFSGGKIVVQKALREKAEAGSLSYTLVVNGPFLDWGLMVGFLIDVKNKQAKLYDGGDRVFSATTLADIGKAVAGVLRKLAETKNRAVYVQSAATTLKALVAAGKKASGQPEAWTETVVPVDDLQAEAFAELKKEKPDPAIFAVKFIQVGIFGEGYGAHFEKLDNELLGIKELSASELDALVARYA